MLTNPHDACVSYSPPKYTMTLKLGVGVTG